MGWGIVTLPRTENSRGAGIYRDIKYTFRKTSAVGFIKTWRFYPRILACLTNAIHPGRHTHAGTVQSSMCFVAAAASGISENHSKSCGASKRYLQHVEACKQQELFSEALTTFPLNIICLGLQIWMVSNGKKKNGHTYRDEIAIGNLELANGASKVYSIYKPQMLCSF